MVKDMWVCIVFLFMLNDDFHATGQPYSQEQSWSSLNLSSVPPDLNVGLRRLDLSNNFISQLHALSLPYLEQLDVSSNQLELISEGFFQTLALLEEVNLSRNMLNNNLKDNARAFRYIKRLKMLDISLNGLSNEAVNMFLESKSSLDELKLSGNALRWLSRSMFADNTNLKTIYIDNNLITVIEKGTFESMAQLETLSLAQNNMANICDFKLYNLKYLNLSQNSIEFFVTHQDDFPYRLETLDLSFNKLLYLPIVPKLNRLRYLHLQQNNIGFLISEAEMVSESNALYNKVVHGSDAVENKNYLHYNLRLMPLIYLDLSSNDFKIFPLETLSLLSSLETLNFSQNCVQNITWNVRKESERGVKRRIFYSSLRHLDLQSNGIIHLSAAFLETLVQIETLNLQENSIEPCPSEDKHPRASNCVSFRLLKTLKHLNLRENDIKIFHNNTFERICLVSLNLGKNPYMVIQKGALEALQTTLTSLTLSELNVSEIFLPCMPALRQLNISNNIMEMIPSSIACSPLTEIDIRNNRLQSVNQSLLDALTKHVQIMYISGNPFNCCKSIWLTELNKSQVAVPDMQNTNCYTGDVEIEINKYVKNPANYCADLKNTMKDHDAAQWLIVVVFLLVFCVAVLIFCKKMSEIMFIV